MKEEFTRQIVKNFKKAIKLMLKPLLIVVGIVIAVFILLSSFVYYITVDDGTYKEGDWTSPGFGVAQNTKTASVDLSSGNLQTSYTAQELWDKMVEEGSRVDEYLSGPEELAKLMNAEIVTQYPDTRSDPDADINWDEILNIDSNELQGIIKLKRNLTTGTTVLSNSDIEDMQEDYEIYKDEYELKKEQEQKEKEEQNKENNKNEDQEENNINENVTANDNSEEIDTTKGMLTFDEWMQNKGYTKNSSGEWTRQGSSIRITYVTPEEFNSYIQEYRNTGSEEAKQKALSHYTLEKANNSNYTNVTRQDSLDNVLFLGDSNTVRLGSGSYLNEDNKSKIQNSIFKAEVGVGPQYWIDNIDSLPSNNSVNAVCVLLGVNSPDSNSMKILIDKLIERYPDKSIYVQKVFPVGVAYGSAASTLNSKISAFNEEVESYCNQKENVFFIDTTEGYVTSDGYLEASKSESDGLHLTDCDTWLENIEYKITKQEGFDDEAINPDNTSEVNSKNEEEDDENKEENKQSTAANIDVDPNISGEAYTSTLNPFYPTFYGQCTWFAWGKFYEIYGYDPGFRSNGKDNASELIAKHPDKFEGSTTTPKVGAIYSCGTNIPYTPSSAGHVGVVVAVEGNKIVTQEGNWAGQLWHRQEWDLNEFIETHKNGLLFANPIDDLTGSNISSTTSKSQQYYIKVATWKETTERYETNDPDNPGYDNGTIYEMTETKINYYDMVKSYTMPFDYLWALMVITEDKDFVFGLADLVYNSNIEITVNDNLSVNTTIKDYTYRKWERIASQAILNDGTTISGGDDLFIDQSAKLTTITKTNTVEAALTRANTWIVDYTKQYKYQKPESTSSTNGPNSRTDLNEKFSNDYDRTDNSDPLGLRAQAEQNDKEVVTVISRYQYANIDWTETINTTIETTKYIGETPEIREKTSKKKKNKEDIGEDGFKYKEKNFVTLLLSNKKAKSNILNVSSWLFEILENNENGSTVDFIELTKYLLYKTTGRDSWGVTDFDFSIFSPDGFSNVNGIYGNTPQEKVWFGLINAGYSKIAAAAVMGNIENESGFRADAIEGGTGIGLGLCQWSFGRRTNLENYIASKGTDSSNVDVQVEFLLGELNPSGGADGYASFQMSGVSSSAYDGNSYTYNDWKDATDIDRATVAFMGLFERPSYNSSINHMEKRKQDARKYYEEFKDKDLSSFSSIPRYYQEDGKWGNKALGDTNIATGGCGFTSVAMVVSGLTGKSVTPDQVVDWGGNTYYVRGQGASWSLFPAAANHYGIKCENLGNNINSAVSALKSGKPVICSQGPGIFTTGGHFIVLSGVNSSGNISVNDPSKNNAEGKGFNSRKFSQSEIAASAKNYWAFSK